ncbi:MAG: RnfABCDGE type electron transport complex subunit B [Endomicrobiia bacterium]
MNIILYSTFIMILVGVIVGFILGFAAEKFKVKSNPKKEKVLEVLPGANCGACGYVGCEMYAENIVEKNVDISLCKPGGNEVVEKIAEIIGKDVVEVQRKVAQVLCNGGDRCKDDFVYMGIKKCSYAQKNFSGQKKCKYACLGFGDCVEICPFNAMYINKYGVAEVDILKCTGCGLCVSVCPQKIIKLVGCEYKVHIKCSSKDKGSVVRQICSVGCVGCGVCVKVCPVKDIQLENNLAIMKYDKCNNCKLCITKCPTKCIEFGNFNKKDGLRKDFDQKNFNTVKGSTKSNPEKEVSGQINLNLNLVK